MSVDIRPARPSDRSAAVALWTELHREHEAHDPRYRLADDAPARWAADFGVWTRSASSRIWLAVGGEAPLGLLTAHLYEPAPTFSPATMVHVDDLYVAPRVRGQGVGRRLLAEARAWAAASGAGEIRAGVLALNGPGRAFWHRAGAADFSVTVVIPV